MEEAVNTGLINMWAYVGMEETVSTGLTNMWAYVGKCLHNTGLTNTWAYVGKEDAEMMNMDGIGLSLSLSHCYTSYEILL